MRYFKKFKNKFNTNFSDVIHLNIVKEVKVMGTFNCLKSYKDRVEAFN